MKITLYNSKGSVGKTPIAVDLALRLNYAIATNEPFHDYLRSIMPKNRILPVKPNKTFPKLPKDLNIIFDLGGFLVGSEKSITTALIQSDLVIIPVYNEKCAIEQTINSIREVQNINKNIFLVATKLEKKPMGKTWEDSLDFLSIKNDLEKENIHFPILPLKYSKIFKKIIENGKSINEITKQNGLNAYVYREINNQFEEITKLIKNYE